MSETVAARLPEELVEQIESEAATRREEKSAIIRQALEKGLRRLALERALELYRDGKVTLWKAASLARLTLWEFLEEVKVRKISLPYTLEEAREDMKAVFGA
jgi:predicted HTH domain antitoxin